MISSRHFGFGPHIMQEYDLSRVLCGTYALMILQETSNSQFWLVGEACVKGIMFESEPELYEHRNFRLCR